MSVSFPGINAPIPKDAEESRWAASPLQQTIYSSGYHSNQWSNCSTELPSRGNPFSQRQHSDYKNSFFSSYAQELDSMLSNYSGYSHYQKPDCVGNSDSISGEGFSRLRGQHTSGLSPSNGNYGSGYSSGSNIMDGFSGGRMFHQFDARSGNLPSASNHSRYSISPNQFAYSRQL